MAFCPYCGSQNDDGAKFCSFCGAKLDSAPAPVPSEPIQETTAPVLRDAGAVPEVPEIPEMPEAPAMSADPGVYAAPEAPVDISAEAAAVPVETPVDVPAVPVEAPVDVPAAPVEASADTPQPAQPVYAQPVYAQPIYSEQPKKKSKKWLIPVIIGAVLLAVLIGLLAKGVLTKSASDPYLGTYKATTVSMLGLDLDPDDIFEGGFIVELEKNGKCHIQAGDERGVGTWEVKDGVITINDGSSSIEGKIEDGVITIENMLDMGLDLTMVKQEE